MTKDKAAQSLGRRGGRAGVGESQVRGDANYYAALWRKTRRRRVCSACRAPLGKLTAAEYDARGGNCGKHGRV